MNLQTLSQKYAKGGAVARPSDEALSREEIEALVAQSLGMQGAVSESDRKASGGYGSLLDTLRQSMGGGAMSESDRQRLQGPMSAPPPTDYKPLLEMLRQSMGGGEEPQGFAQGGAVFGGGGAQSGEGTSQAALSPEMIARMLGSQGEGLLQVTHTPSAYWYDQNYDPAYAARYWAEVGQPEPQRPAGGTQEVPYTPPNYGGGAVFGGGSNMGGAPAPAAQAPVYTPPPAPPATPPGPAAGGMGAPSMEGQTRYPYMPTTVYQTMPQMSSQGSYFPINYNPAKINELMNHLRSQMYA